MLELDRSVGLTTLSYESPSFYPSLPSAYSFVGHFFECRQMISKIVYYFLGDILPIELFLFADMYAHLQLQAPYDEELSPPFHLRPLFPT